jgi:hypothetical protein
MMLSKNATFGSFKRSQAPSSGTGNFSGKRAGWQPGAPAFAKRSATKKSDCLSLLSLDVRFLEVKAIKDKKGVSDVVLRYDEAGAAAAAAAVAVAAAATATAEKIGEVGAAVRNSDEGLRTRLPILRVAQSSRTSGEADLGAVKTYNGKEAVIRRGGQNKAMFMLALYGEDLSDPVLTEAQRADQVKCFAKAYEVSRAIMTKVFEAFRVEALRAPATTASGWIAFCASAIEKALWPTAAKLGVSADVLKKRALAKPDGPDARALFDAAAEAFVNGARKMPGKPWVKKSKHGDGTAAEDLGDLGDIGGAAGDADGASAAGDDATAAAKSDNKAPDLLFIERAVWSALNSEKGSSHDSKKGFYESKAEGPPHTGPTGLASTRENWPTIVTTMAGLGAKYNAINFTDGRTGKKLRPSAQFGTQTLEDPWFDPVKINKSGKPQEALVQLDAFWRIYIGPSSYGVRLYVGGDVAIAANQISTKNSLIIEGMRGYNDDDEEDDSVDSVDNGEEKKGENKEADATGTSADSDTGAGAAATPGAMGVDSADGAAVPGYSEDTGAAQAPSGDDDAF